MTERTLSPKEASQYLGKAPNYLYNLRKITHRKSPACLIDAATGSVRYRVEALNEWAGEHPHLFKF